MSEKSSGTIAMKRKKNVSPDKFSPKIQTKYIRTKRGLFKDFNPTYTCDNKTQYPILLSSNVNEKIDIFQVNKILKSQVEGVEYVKAISNFYMKIIFKNKTTANSFLLNNSLLTKNNWTARIPFDQVESQGIVRIPVTVTEEDLLESLISENIKIIGVKRFQKRLPDGSFQPLPTVLLTFFSTNRPDHVTYEHIWFKVTEYIRPLLQCFNCYKFHHGSGSCKNKKVCSICAGDHDYRLCNKQESLCCVNCKGDHIAISYSCPIKAAKIAIIKNKISGKTSYASVVKNTSQQISTPSSNHISNENNELMEKRSFISKILNSDLMLHTITKTVLDIISKKEANISISTKLIKELLINNINDNGNKKP